MKITVLGCGRWGTFHAWYADHIGHDVLLWGRPGSKHLSDLAISHHNEYLELPSSIKLTNNLKKAIAHADTIIISISAQELRNLATQISHETNHEGKRFILCMKGLETHTGKRLTTVFKEVLGNDVPVAVWVGPGHVQDFLKGIPNCMVMASSDMNLAKELVNELSSPLVRFYYGEDLLGTEVGAAAKNVVGIAAGMLDGIGYCSLKGALMARGTRELSRLIEAMGGDKMTVYGLSHLGDYEATLFSSHSRNRRCGEQLIRTGVLDEKAEGVPTSAALIYLSRKYDIELPICETVYTIVYKHADPKEQLTKLFLRSVKAEMS